MTSTLKKLFGFSALLVLMLSAIGRASDSTATEAAENHQELTRELTFRIANESNQIDGVFGPVTYGLKGVYEFRAGPTVEGTFIRLHEQGTAFAASFLDEGQLTMRFPAATCLGQPLTIAGTAWINRMVDMYTNVGGVDFSREGKFVSLSAGLYAGTATRDEASGRFLGVELGIERSFGAVDVSLSQMSGVIRTLGDPSGIGEGRYSKTGIDAAFSFNRATKFPLAVTMSIEKRYFNFGNGGPANDAKDAYIFIAGMEITVQHIL